ncbi:MAG: class IIb bacteriocin, lactobin A/cerein 7B family [Labilibaculum antarcticum]
MNLENLGVQEMNAQEMKNVDGGFVILACIALALLASSCISPAY